LSPRDSPGVNTLYCLEESRGEQRISPPGDNFAPRGQNSPLGDKFAPGGQSLPLGVKLTIGHHVPQSGLILTLVSLCRTTLRSMTLDILCKPAFAYIFSLVHLFSYICLFILTLMSIPTLGKNRVHLGNFRIVARSTYKLLHKLQEPSVLVAH
jgi:hypothetical protein